MEYHRSRGYLLPYSHLGKSFILLIVVGLLLAIPWPGMFYVLEVIHLPQGRVLMSLPFALHHSFSLSYTHSIYLAPVVEKFELEGARIYLRKISTNNWGVIEYYGLSDGAVRKDQGEIEVKGIDLRVPRLTTMLGFIGKQRLIWDDRTYSLSSLAGPGEEVTIEPVCVSPGRYLLERAK